MKTETKIEKRQVGGNLSTDLNELFDYICDILKLNKDEQRHHGQIKGDVKIAPFVRFLQFNELPVYIDFKQDKISVYYELTVEDSAPEIPSSELSDEDNEKIADWLKD